MAETTRRALLKAAGGGALAAAATQLSTAAPAAAAEPKFTVKFAPHFGMFRNHAPGGVLDELKFAADQGFTAWEDNGMGGRPVEEQERIAREMQRLGITMGVFVVNGATAWGPNFAPGTAEGRDKFLAECRGAVEVAKRVNAKWMTVVPGTLEPRLEMGFQTANVIDALRRAAAIFEPHYLVMVIESLNPWRDHPGMFLSKIPQAYAVCRAVNSPSCKILFDIYHQQITEGNLIPNMDAAWDEVAYFQIGDNPGRNEPTTGEINYKNVFAHIHGKSYTGILGMEHGNSQPDKAGEQKVIAAYRTCNPG